jgi:acyl carrier protein
MTWTDVEEKVKRIIVNQLGIDPADYTLHARFVDDFGADSLDVVELVMELESEFQMEIADEEAEKQQRVEDVLNYLVRFFPGTDRESISSKVIAFRIREDGRIEVGLQQTDGTWIYADGTSRLPSGLYLTVFSRWESVLKELEEMVNSPAITESELQHFFERYPDLLKGDEYDVMIPQARIVPVDASEWKADFVLHPFDQTAFSKVLELKMPRLRTAREPKSQHSRFYADLFAAINQLRDYGAAFHDRGTRARFKEMYGIEVYRPDLQLITGRKWDKEYMERMLELQRRNDVRITDWDSHLEALRRKFT